MKQNLGGFVRDIGNEMKKVSWPSREQLQESTIVTIVVCLIITTFVFIVDQIFSRLFGLVFG